MSLLQTIDHIPGIGPATQARFNKLNIFTFKDLLFHFPLRYDDVQVRGLKGLLDGEKVTLKGTIVTEPVTNYYGRRRNRLVFQLKVDDHALVPIIFFNQAYLAKNLQIGQDIAVYGKWQTERQQLLGMRIIRQSEEDGDLAPVYPATQGLKQTQIIKAINYVLEAMDNQIEDVIPSYLNEKYRLISLNDALQQIHHPHDRDSFHQAERKLIYFEFFIYQWQLQASNVNSQAQSGIRITYPNIELKNVINALPYELTHAQKRAINEICYDLMAPYPMRRMLQGDVGSGKTLVAFIAMIATMQAGYQALLMAPTEVLAKQHFTQFQRLFGSKVAPYLLTGSLSTRQREDTYSAIYHGQAKIIIGTHALIQSSLKFNSLGLAVIDEQHRFGVEQRQAIIEKGNSKDTILNILQMTATPIPRSLAQTIYGDMSVSTIDEMPQGRHPIQTEVVSPDEIEIVYQRMQHELQKGHQIYYVLPLIDQSESMEEVDHVTGVMERLSHIFPDVIFGCMHGQLNTTEQSEIMTEFKNGKIKILVATTIIEVGVDVPNATVMVIQSAERFGLAQLHQLRGRVGRGEFQSYCYLVGKPTTPQGQERLKTMAEEIDGFKISQVDMRLRGAGDLFGLAQSGLPEFKYASLIEDQIIHQYAQNDVKEILSALPKSITASEMAKINQWIDDIEILI